AKGAWGMSFLRNPRADGPDSPAPPSLATRSAAMGSVAPGQQREVDQLEMDRQPEDGEDDGRDPGGGDELLLELRIDRRAGIGAVVGQARVGATGHAKRQYGEQHGPPDGQVDRDQGDGAAHQCASSQTFVVTNVGSLLERRALMLSARGFP